MENLEVLSRYVGKEKAEELLKLTKAYDSYVSKFKKKMNNLLADLDYEVKTGVVFSKKEQGE